METAAVQALNPAVMIGLAYGGAAIMVGLAIMGAGIGLGMLGNGATQAIARQPEQAGRINGMFYVALALIEGVALITLAMYFVFPGLATSQFGNLIQQAIQAAG